MKKILLLLSFVILCNPAFAHIAHVKSTETFSTANPPETIKVETVKDFTLTKNIKIPAGNIIEGQIKIKQPKRLKRDATFTFVPLKYTYGKQYAYKINKKYTGYYLKPVNKAELAKSAALKVGNSVVPGMSTGYSIVKGAIENEEGNVIKSAANSFYESSPLSLVKKGNHIEIKKDENFNIIFKPNRFNFKKYQNDIELIAPEKEIFTASPV